MANVVKIVFGERGKEVVIALKGRKSSTFVLILLKSLSPFFPPHFSSLSLSLIFSFRIFVFLSSFLSFSCQVINKMFEEVFKQKKCYSNEWLAFCVLTLFIPLIATFDTLSFSFKPFSLCSPSHREKEDKICWYQK